LLPRSQAWERPRPGLPPRGRTRSQRLDALVDDGPRTRLSQAVPRQRAHLARPVPLFDKDLKRLRRSVRRGTPFGDPTSTESVAGQLDLEDTLRAPGRPRQSDTGPDSQSSTPTLFY
jgi:hypothetical protein